MRTSVPPVSNPIPGFLYANLPLASGYAAGYRVRATDQGIPPGLILVSDGTRWVIDGLQLFAASAVPVSAPADTNEDTLATVSFPANLFGLTGGFDLEFTGSQTGSANNKTWKAHWSGIGGTAFLNIISSAPSAISFQVRAQNNGAAVQMMSMFASEVINAFAPGAVDTTVATTLVLTVQKALNTETTTLRQYRLWVHP